MTGHRTLRINVNVSSAGGHPAAWRRADGHRYGFMERDYYTGIAQIAERGLLDAVLLADQVSLWPDIASGRGWGTTDPVVTAAMMAAVTTSLGFIATATTTFSHPYSLARAFSSLDHMSGGRIGLNLVTTMAPHAARNFGLKEMPTHDERYERAAEFGEVLIALWDSWEDGALLGDRQSGEFADPTRIHAIDHVGKHFSVAGPLQLPRSPQGRPLLVQAGGSEQGRDFAARHADAVFSVSQYLTEGQSYYADMKARVRQFGRSSDSIAVLPGLTLVIGGTEAEAKARKRELDELAGEQRTLRQYADRAGLAVADLKRDEPISAAVMGRIRQAPGSHGFRQALLSTLQDRSLAVRQILERGSSHRVFVGAPEQIAYTMEEWFVNAAADGFNIMSDVYPAGLEAFVDHVVPVLQRRQLFRRCYAEDTLRQRYGLAYPVSRFQHLQTAPASAAELAG
jgi:FMN-dependent oxidoreductase (nitrilotriacetate monooxygenase family)